jgi:drug/metabolite transporter (DMT)-like permease
VGEDRPATTPARPAAAARRGPGGRASDYLGIGLGLLAAACWAAYIVLNRLLGARLPGL